MCSSKVQFQYSVNGTLCVSVRECVCLIFLMNILKSMWKKLESHIPIYYITMATNYMCTVQYVKSISVYLLHFFKYIILYHPGCKPKKSCPDGQVYKNGTHKECVPRARCKPVCMVLDDGREVSEGEVIEEDACHTCRCSKKQKICTGQPCTTIVQTVSMPL